MRIRKNDYESLRGAVLVTGELYAAYAGVVYWRLRPQMPAEIAVTRSWIRCTPPWHLLAGVLLPALPAITRTCIHWDSSTTDESRKAMPRSWSGDQVARQADFSQAHPEVTFEFRPETGHWEATYPAGANGTQTVHGQELGEVLDKLEENFR